MPRLSRLPNAPAHPLLLTTLSLVSALLLPACAGPGESGLAPLPGELPAATGKTSPPAGGKGAGKGWVDPDVLAVPRGEDKVLMVCGGKKFRKHRAFDLLMEQDPRRGLQILHAMADLALAREVAGHEGVRVPLCEVDRLVRLGMKKDLERARRSFGPQATLEDFAALELGMTLEEYKAWLRKMASRQLLLSYTVVYTAIREDRVQCRIMTLPSREEALRLARSVRDGADFQTLARKYSLDPTAVQGGKIPPFTREFEHPAARAAFKLREGEVSDPIPGRQGGKPVWYLVFLEKRIPGRKGTFRELEGEVRRRVRESPPGPEDFLAFFGAARRRYGLRLFPPGNTRGAHERGTRSILPGNPASTGESPGGGGPGSRGNSRSR